MKHSLFAALMFLLYGLARGQGSATLQDKEFRPKFTPDSSLSNWLNEFTCFRSLSQPEKDVIYWINTVRKDPKGFSESILKEFLQEFPEIRNSYSASLNRDLNNLAPLELLKPSEILASCAKSHAADLGQNAKKLSHSSTNGKSFQDRIVTAGVRKCATENLLEGKKDGLEAVLLLLIDSNVPDKGHRKAILDPNVHSIGVAFSFFQANKTYVLVQDFSCE